MFQSQTIFFDSQSNVHFAGGLDYKSASMMMTSLRLIAVFVPTALTATPLATSRGDRLRYRSHAPSINGESSKSSNKPSIVSMTDGAAGVAAASTFRRPFLASSPRGTKASKRDAYPFAQTFENDNVNIGWRKASTESTQTLFKTHKLSKGCKHSPYRA